VIVATKPEKSPPKKKVGPEIEMLRYMKTSHAIHASFIMKLTNRTQVWRKNGL
jgi:hypothetical protein